MAIKVKNNIPNTQVTADNSNYDTRYIDITITANEGWKIVADSVTTHYMYNAGAGSRDTDAAVEYVSDTEIRLTGNNWDEKSDLTVNGESEYTATGTGTVTNNVPNTTDKSAWQPDEGYGAFWYLQLQANDGYKFKGDVKASYISTDGTPKEITLEVRNDYNVWTYVYDSVETTDFVITGETVSDRELDVTNNVPNTTAVGEKLDMWRAKVTLTANEGFKITRAQVAFTGGYDYPETADMEISEDGKTANWQNEDCDPDRGVTITDTTASEGVPELNVTNNITETLNETHTYDGETATFTVESKHYPRFRFIDPKVNYTGKDGQPKSVDMQVEVLSYYSLATATVTDIDPTKPVTLTGKFVDVAHIDSYLSNCYADPPLPEWLQFGETLNITIKANPNTEFHPDDETESPTLTWQNEFGYYQSMPLTVSEDKTTATGSKVLDADLMDFAVNADAFPVEVVGERYGAINVYLVTLDELAEFSAKRFFKETGTDPSTGAPTYENIDLGAYVNKIRRIYTNIGASSTDVIRCGNYNTGVSCHQPDTDKITLDFGTAVVPAHNEDNTDYESEVQIFLPFAGFVTINNDYAGKTIALQYVINVVTGNGVALLSCDGVVFQVEETEPSSEIIYLSPSTQVKTVGGDDWNEMLYYGIEPYIYCKWYESQSNGRNTDRKSGILGDFRGFNIFDDVTPIHTPEMLTEEQQSIYTALSDGVYIE